MAVLKSEIKRFHRFHGYDYSRGAVLFITFGLKKRLPVFGRAEGDKVVYNKVGEAAVETMQREMRRNANLVVHRFVIMPDHVHWRIYIRPNAMWRVPTRPMRRMSSPRRSRLSTAR